MNGSLAPGLLVAGPRSGVGKTIVATGLQRAFVQAGLSVVAAKCGPDYIDPGFHAIATGRPAINLDGFAMEPAMLKGLAAQHATCADLVIAEAAMGLFDGAGPASTGAAVARLTGWPVLLVVDAEGAGQSAAAVAHGMATFPGAPPVAPPVAPPIAGVIVNRVASDRHAAMIAEGFRSLDLPLLGMIRRDPALIIASRHLGLVQASEDEQLGDRLNAVAAIITRDCDLAAIRDAARASRAATRAVPRIRPPGQRIALAADDAFAFFYPHLALWWREAGAEIRTFSPLADEAPPADCDTCWLPGGYPELHAGKLATSTRFMAGLRAFAARAPVHGECGGYMLLGRSIEDAQGAVHPMAGLLPVDTSFARRKMTLGYRQAHLFEATAFADANAPLWGHEYHYATIRSAAEGQDLARLSDAAGNDLGGAGHRVGHITGSFFHLIA